MDGRLDEPSLVLDDGELHVGQIERQLLHVGEHGLHDVDRAGIGLLVDGDAEALDAVEPHDGFALGVLEDDAGDVLHVHRNPEAVLGRSRRAAARACPGSTGGRSSFIDGAGAFADDQVLDLANVAEATEPFHLVRLIAVLQTAAGDVLVGLLDLLHHRAVGKAEGLQQVRVEDDANFFFSIAFDLGGGDTVEGLEARLHQGVDGAEQLVEVGVVGRSHRDARYRQRLRVFLRHVEAFDLVVGSVGTHALLDVEKREVHVGVPAELRHHDGLPGTGNRVDPIDAADRADVALQAPGVALFHLLRRLPGNLQINGNDRRLHIGQQVGAEAVERDPAEQHDGEGRHHDGDRVAG